MTLNDIHGMRLLSEHEALKGRTGIIRIMRMERLIMRLMPSVNPKSLTQDGSRTLHTCALNILQRLEGGQYPPSLYEQSCAAMSAMFVDSDDDE